jgi:hypothetical protein
MVEAALPAVCFFSGEWPHPDRIVTMDKTIALCISKAFIYTKY